MDHSGNPGAMGGSSFEFLRRRMPPEPLPAASHSPCPHARSCPDSPAPFPPQLSALLPPFCHLPLGKAERSIQTLIQPPCPLLWKYSLFLLLLPNEVSQWNNSHFTVHSIFNNLLSCLTKSAKMLLAKLIINCDLPFPAYVYFEEPKHAPMSPWTVLSHNKNSSPGKLFLVLKFPVLFCSFRHINYSFFFLQPISNADFIVPVEIDGTIHQVRNQS